MTNSALPACGPRSRSRSGASRGTARTKTTEKFISPFVARNPLISLDSDEKIQGNPRKSKAHHSEGLRSRNGHAPRKSKSTGRAPGPPPGGAQPTPSKRKAPRGVRNNIVFQLYPPGRAVTQGQKNEPKPLKRPARVQKRTHRRPCVARMRRWPEPAGLYADRLALRGQPPGAPADRRPLKYVNPLDLNDGLTGFPTTLWHSSPTTLAGGLSAGRVAAMSGRPQGRGE